jgi:hypothetical protein
MSDDFASQKAQQCFRKFISELEVYPSLVGGWVLVSREEALVAFLVRHPEFEEFREDMGKVRSSCGTFRFREDAWEQENGGKFVEAGPKYRPSDDWDMVGFLWELVRLTQGFDFAGGVVGFPARVHTQDGEYAVVEVRRERRCKSCRPVFGWHEEFGSRLEFRESVESRLKSAQHELLDPEEEGVDLVESG